MKVERRQPMPRDWDKSERITNQIEDRRVPLGFAY
jgi:hypothetical protein